MHEAFDHSPGQALECAGGHDGSAPVSRQIAVLTGTHALLTGTHALLTGTHALLTGTHILTGTMHAHWSCPRGLLLDVCLRCWTCVCAAVLKRCCAEELLF
jgi:hypothetical protein